MSAALGSAHAAPTPGAPRPGADSKSRQWVKVSIDFADGIPLGWASVAVEGESALDTAAGILALIAAHYDATGKPSS